MPRRTTNPVDIVVYRGIKFRRYPDSPNWSDRSYFTPAGNHRKRGVGRLHQEIWKDIHGPIPPDHDVHHADHNPLNNDPDNLVLLVGRDHGRHHMATPERLAHARVAIEIAREAARVWHGSDAGIAWHREHGRETWVGREVRDETCEQCGAVYQTRTSNQFRFCSNNCKSQARRLSGVDDEQRICEVCGIEFTINRYAKARTCSRACGQALRHGRPRTGVQPDSGG